MDDISNQERAIELLQQLGLKEYEAKSFVALSRQESGTAKDISETSEVPRTRVYDAIRVLESKGLVEIQHANPQVFRAVSVDEAANTLQAVYEERIESLRQTLRGLEPIENDDRTKVTHEVWTLSGKAGITSRVNEMIEAADEEVLLVIGDEAIFTEQLVESLRAANDGSVDVVVGTITPALRETVRDALPEIEVFVSDIEWLRASALSADETEIGRLLMVDREAILVSSFTESADGAEDEHAVFGQGFDNGLVAIVRRLMAAGLLTEDEPETGDA